jgi:MFS family permease
MTSLTWRLNIATMLFFTIVQLVVPLIPQYAEKISNDPVLIGLAVGSISVTAILLRPVSGVASDRWSRSMLMVLGLVLGSLAYFLLYLSSDVLHIVVARLIEGTAVASFIPSSIASAVDQAPEGKLGQTLGWRSMMIGIGFTIGPGIGGIMAAILDYKRTFEIASILLLFLIPLAIFRKSQRHPSAGGHSIHGLRERGFIISLCALIVYALAWYGLYTFLSAYLVTIGYGPLEIGLFVIIQAASSLALRVFAGRVADKRPAMMAYVGLLVMTLGLFLVYLTQLPPYLYVAAPVYGIGIGLYVPGSQTLALMKSPPDSRGYLSSIYTMGMDIGALIGPIIFGLLIEFTGSYQGVFVLAPILMFVAALIVIIPARTFHM